MARARKFDLQADGDYLVNEIKQATWFPVKTGNLRDNATSGIMMPLQEPVYRIRFDSSIAPYIKYVEEGRMNRKRVASYYGTSTLQRARSMAGLATPFNPLSDTSQALRIGSKMGFISDKTINFILDYFVKKYDGEIRK